MCERGLGGTGIAATTATTRGEFISRQSCGGTSHLSALTVGLSNPGPGWPGIHPNINRCRSSRGRVHGDTVQALIRQFARSRHEPASTWGLRSNARDEWEEQWLRGDTRAPDEEYRVPSQLPLRWVDANGSWARRIFSAVHGNMGCSLCWALPWYNARNG